MWRTTFAIPTTPTRLVTTPSLFAVTPTQWLACISPPSSLDPKLPSGAFAVAKDDSRDRFMGDRRSLNSRERSIGRAHLPYCQRQRRLMLRKSETVQTTVRGHPKLLLLVRGSPVACQKPGDPPSQCQLEHLDDETWDVVDPDDIESWISQDLLKTCASFKIVSATDYCRFGMTANIMGDVNAVHTLECTHRRQLLVARALNELFLLIRRPPFPHINTIGDVYIDDLVILSVLPFSNVHVASLPIKVRRADALYDFLQMPTNVGKSGSTLTGEFWRGHLDRVAGTLGFPLERRVSLMLITMLVAATGANRTLFQRLLGGWAFALTFRREAFACLGVACSGAASLAPSKRCRVSGALTDELLLITGLSLLLETNFWAESLREAPRCRCLTRWCWRERRVHHAGGLARPARFGRRKGGAISP